MTDKIVTVDCGRGTWQGPESKAPVCNDGPQLEALAEAGQQMPHVVYEPYPGAFDHLLGAESNMQEPHTAPSGDLTNREAAIDAMYGAHICGIIVEGKFHAIDLATGEAAIRALPAQGQPAAPAAKVKPLVWRDSFGVLRAETPFGDYKVAGKVLHRLGSPAAQTVYGSSAEAQAAAQADYEARILSALEGQP